ncbi:MAG TPA: glycine betaine ABC transporter substrate-binding protein [Baekduia sp.]|nr:glycine betaine ABC transporter substrate-binding protein [Baekduia sp.]
MLDALEFLIRERESVAGGVEIGGEHLLPLLGRHLLVSAEALVIAVLVALPPALWLAHQGRGRVVAGTLANAGRALPTFAVVVFTAAYFGFTSANLVFALVLLAIPPIFTNAYVGVRQVAPEAVDAARGMGMSSAQVVGRVELPLALPLVFGGIRTSAVNVIATATLGPYVGVETLGEPIINANVYGDSGRLGGAILVALLAVLAELLFAALQRAVTPRGVRSPPPTHRRTRTMRRMTTALLTAALAFGLVACGDDDEPSAGTGAAQGGNVLERDDANASKPEITIGSKNFTEQFILGEIYAQALQEAGYKVRKQLNLGSEQIALKALKSGRVDAYPEYTGTALTSFCDVKPVDVPKSEQTAYQDTKRCLARQGITALPATPFTNSNGFAVTQETAEELGGITKLSELQGKSRDLTLSGGPECRQREDCLLGLQDVYDLRFKRFLSIDLAQRHEVLKDGRSDVGLVFTTDGQIKADNLVLLDDDRSIFPPYNVSLVTRDETLQQAGGSFRQVIALVQRGLTTEVMQELNSRVDLDKEQPADVARQYLTEAGYLAD